MIGSSAVQVLRRSNAAALLALSLLLGLAAPNEAHAQQGCRVGTAIERAEIKFDHHRQQSNGKLTVATAAFASSASSVAENVGTHSVAVNLSQTAPAGGLTINYSVAGTATAGSGNDFTITNSGSVIIAAGASSANIPVVILDDSAEEAGETVVLTLTSGTGYTLGSPTTHTLTITENDRPPINGRLAILGGSPLPEGAGFGFNVALSRALRADEMATLPLIIGGTATRGTDYRLSCVSQEPQVFFTCSGLGGNNPSITFNGAIVFLIVQRGRCI